MHNEFDRLKGKAKVRQKFYVYLNKYNFYRKQLKIIQNLIFYLYTTSFLIIFKHFSVFFLKFLYFYLKLFILFFSLFYFILNISL